MPKLDTIETFVALVEAGDYTGAIERFYAPEASTWENNAAQVTGRDAALTKERGVMASFTKIEASRLGPPLISGDHVALRWRFAFTSADGRVRRMEEVAWQTWRDEQVVEERFFYDPKQMTG